MAQVYGKATLSPTKRDLLNAWLPTRQWFPADARVGKLRAYRFDDPAGEVGLESFVLDVADGVIVHVPLTYRDAPLTGAEAFLVGTADHSVLGERWVYDGCGDPAWAAALANAILGGGTEAEVFAEGGERREPKVTVKGSGTAGASVAVPASVQCEDDGRATVTHIDGMKLVTVRLIGTDISANETLVARWGENNEAVVAGIA
ncbi:MAG TPA: hypothetical protein VFZ37_02950 [Jiangellaceae bacterium]